MHDRQPLRVSVGFSGRASQHTMAGEQVVDLTGHLDASVREENEEVGDALKLGQHVGGQQHRDALVDRGGQDRGHEVVPRDRVEHRHRLIQDEQPRPPCQRQS